MAHFKLGAEEEPSANETAELAGKLKVAGYLVDQSELEEQVGMKLVKDEPPAQGAFPAFNKLLNKAGEDRPDARPSKDEHPNLLAAFAADTTPIGEAVKELLKDPTPEAAKALLDRLPSLLPDDPAMAAVLAEAMAEEFGVMLANENPYHCPKCGKFSGFNGHCDKCGYTLDAGETEKRAERLLNKSLDGAMFKPVQGIAYRDGLGQIDLDVGKKGEGKGMEHGNGISKINQKHRDMISHLPRTIAHGKIYRVRPGNNPSNPFDDTQRAIVHGNISIFLSEKRKGVWKIDSIYDDVKKVEKIERAAAV